MLYHHSPTCHGNPVFPVSGNGTIAHPAAQAKNLRLRLDSCLPVTLNIQFVNKTCQGKYKNYFRCNCLSHLYHDPLVGATFLSHLEDRKPSHITFLFPLYPLQSVLQTAAWKIILKMLGFLRASPLLWKPRSSQCISWAWLLFSSPCSFCFHHTGILLGTLSSPGLCIHC